MLISWTKLSALTKAQVIWSEQERMCEHMGGDIEKYRNNVPLVEGEVHGVKGKKGCSLEED